MALSFIGKPISLISHSDVRYRGILAGIDPVASTIQLSKVYSMGTESRKPPNEFIPPVQDPYEYIIFRASEVKDLSVDEPAMARSVHDDPAVIGASAQTLPQPPQQAPYSPFVSGQAPAAAYAQQQQAQQRVQQAQAQTQAQVQQPPRQQQPAAAAAAAVVTNGGATGAARNQLPRRANNNVHTAAASLETVERAIGDLRVSNNTNAGRGGAGRRGGNPHVAPKPIHVPNTDFDFESSNARFDKGALGAAGAKGGSAGTGAGGVDGSAGSDVETNPSDGEGEGGDKEKEKGKGKVKESTAYHPQKSFFDELTPGPTEVRGGGRGGRRGGGPGARNRREEERERNVATFGEPGGVGLMGPGAYVGGWGGYGRRGGGRGGIRGGRGRGRGGPSVGVGA